MDIISAYREAGTFRGAAAITDEEPADTDDETAAA